MTGRRRVCCFSVLSTTHVKCFVNLRCVPSQAVEGRDRALRSDGTAQICANSDRLTDADAYRHTGPPNAAGLSRRPGYKHTEHNGNRYTPGDVSDAAYALPCQSGFACLRYYPRQVDRSPFTLTFSDGSSIDYHCDDHAAASQSWLAGTKNKAPHLLGTVPNGGDMRNTILESERTKAKARRSPRTRNTRARTHIEKQTIPAETASHGAADQRGRNTARTNHVREKRLEEARRGK